MHFNTLIIMNEDVAGYGNRSRKPSGYCKLTMPNRIICYVQGLRQLPKGQDYKLYLISNRRQKSIDAGSFRVGLNGSKETRWIMDPTNINNSGVSAKEVDGALIVAQGDNKQEQIVPLVGFSADPYEWAALIETKREIKAVPKQEVPIEPKVEATPEPKRPVGVEAAPEPKVEPKVDPEVKELVREAPPKEDEILALREEIKRLNETIDQSRAIITSLKLDLEKEAPRSAPEPVGKGVNDYVNNFIRKFQAGQPEASQEESQSDQGELASIFAKRIPINPFEAQNTGIKWVRITYEDLESFPSLDREWISQPLIRDANRNYKHFILGRDQCQTYYVGIPGVFDPNIDDPLKIDKIERFSCCHNIPPKIGAVGYWIARI